MRDVEISQQLTSSLNLRVADQPPEISLLPGAGGGLPVQEWLHCCELHCGALIDACGLATLMPEEETGSPGEVRSQWRRCLLIVGE